MLLYYIIKETREKWKGEEERVWEPWLRLRHQKDVLATLKGTVKEWTEREKEKSVVTGFEWETLGGEKEEWGAGWWLVIALRGTSGQTVLHIPLTHSKAWHTWRYADTLLPQRMWKGHFAWEREGEEKEELVEEKERGVEERETEGREGRETRDGKRRWS